MNREPYFLGMVTRAVLFGSLLNPEVELVSDVDLAVEIVQKETDSDRARNKNYDRVEALTASGQRFRSRVIALADYAAEKSFILAVPHRFLIGKPDRKLPSSRPSRARERAQLAGGIRTIAHFENQRT